MAETTEPLSIIAGDTLAWTKSIEGYSAADGWVLSYILVSSGKTTLSIGSTASGSDHAVSVTAATTAAYVPGEYHWTSMVTKAGERKTIASGVLTILPNPVVGATFDPRTHAEKCLAGIEAVLEGRVSDAMVEYQINNRTIKYIPHGELMRLRALYRAEVRRERGQSAVRIIPVRFGHV
jgi:hypothetical protein